MQPERRSMAEDVRPYMIMARAIKKADTRYFFEDYTKQANAAIRALNRAGYAIVPVRPNQEMVKAAVEALQYGVNRTQSVVEPLYRAMIDAAPDPYGNG
jgi:predicted CoA-binding protein